MWSCNLILGTYLEKAINSKNIGIPIFITALFTTAKTWKQPKCPLTDEWIKKTWNIYIYNGILLSHKKEWSNGLPWWLGGKESTCQCRRHWFHPWSKRIPHAMEQLRLCATTTEPVPQSPGTAAPEAHVPQSRRSTRKITMVRSLRTAKKRSSCSPHRKACTEMKTQHSPKQ